MSTNIRVNSITATITDTGYPVWVNLTHETAGCSHFFGTMSHRELVDLKFAVERSIAAAREALPEGHKHEVD